MISIKNKKAMRVSSAFFCMAAALILSGCSDWDDHYAADNQVQSTSTQTIWQNISARPELSQFKSLVEKAGMAETLDEVNSYTVWAPKNGTFNFDSVNNVSNSLLIAQFVKNHTAQYAHSITGSDSIRVLMLNEKKKRFQGSPGHYSIAGINISDANIASSNGYLHVIDEAIPYRYSIFESLNNQIYPIDSVSDYIHAYDVHEFDINLSTEGPMLHGERTYLDSVYHDYNRYLEYGPFINEEDSSYTMIVPTNRAWQNSRAAIKKYFRYAPSYKFLDGTADTERTKNTKETTAIDAEYLSDSISTLLLMENLVMNNNLYDNANLLNFDGTTPVDVDSLVFGGETFKRGNFTFRSYGTKIYRNDARELMQDMTLHEASNGNMLITDSLHWHPWNYWNPVIVIEGEWADIANSENTVSAQPSGVGAGQQNPAIEGKVSNNAFLNVTARANRNPKTDIYLEGIHSTEYNIYVVVLPNNITNKFDTIPRKNQLQFIIGNNDENGELTTWGWKNGELVEVKNNRISTFFGDVIESDPTKIDTLFVGTVNFPIAYTGYPGVDYHASPFIRIEDCVERWNGEVTSDLRLDCIILVPTEFDAYLREHPEYYDDRTGKNKYPWPLKPEE